MSKAADHTEQVLRELHILFSKAPAFERGSSNVVVDKMVVIDKLRELRRCLHEMMDEYELTQQSKEKAAREVQRENDELIYASTKQAQDIYAAAVMYSDRSLTELQDSLRLMQDNMEQMQSDMNRRIRDEMQQLKTNQLELKSRLEGLLDTDMYLRLIDDANWRREKEKQRAQYEPADTGAYAHVKADIRVDEDLIEAIGGGDAPPPLSEKNYADIVPEIKVNEEYFAKTGAATKEPEDHGTKEKRTEPPTDDIDIDKIGADVIAETLSSESIADGHAEESILDGQISQDISEEELAEISANLDAEYFGWKKEAEEELAAQDNIAKKKKKRRR